MKVNIDNNPGGTVSKALTGSRKIDISKKWKDFQEEKSLPLRKIVSILRASNSKFSSLSPTTIMRWQDKPTNWTELALTILKDWKPPLPPAGPLGSHREEMESIYAEFNNLRKRLRAAIDEERERLKELKEKL